jgi:hypothetical protein
MQICEWESYAHICIHLLFGIASAGRLPRTVPASKAALPCAPCSMCRLFVRRVVRPPHLLCCHTTTPGFCIVTATPTVFSFVPCRYIRYIYNRIILENATVRAAAVSALANFGAKVGGGHASGVECVRGCDGQAVARGRGVVARVCARSCPLTDFVLVDLDR